MSITSLDVAQAGFNNFYPLAELPADISHVSPDANRNILWGWKRDLDKQSRTVYFSGQLCLQDNNLGLGRRFFHYSTTVEEEAASNIRKHLNSAKELLAENGEKTEFTEKRAHVAGGRSWTLTFTFGNPTAADQDRVVRLRRRRPRRRFILPSFPEKDETLDAALSAFPADLYVGSGLSYEAGLPTLCDMHDAFGVDSTVGPRFAVGLEDELPSRLSMLGHRILPDWCRVHTQAFTALPTFAMRYISDLQRTGIIGQIFTDNVDNMLSKVNARHQRVRGSGVFNERYEASFTSDTLVVIGVAADRRQIIRQARSNGLRIVVVNPCHKVSPNVTHLDYLKAHDTFFRQTAAEFFNACTEASQSQTRLRTSVR